MDRGVPDREPAGVAAFGYYLPPRTLEVKALAGRKGMAPSTYEKSGGGGFT